MDVQLDLDPFDRMAIILVGTFIVITSALITSCFVIPGCCGYKCMHKAKRKESMIMLDPTGKRVSILLNDKKSPLYEAVGSHLQVIETQKNGTPGQLFSFNSSYAPTTLLPFPPPPPIKPPNAHINISYCSEHDALSMGRLNIEIVEVENLPRRDYPTLPDSTVVMEVFSRQWNPLKQDQVIHRVQTRLTKSEASPVFEQTFNFAATKSDLKSMIIKLTATDEDRTTRCRETCSGKIHFKDIQKLTDGAPCSLSVPLEAISSNFGELLVALSYLPTAQRLSVSVIQAAKLKWEQVTPSLKHFHPYVRVVLLDHAGRILKKKRISGTSGTESPTFSGSLCFQVSHIVFETATLLLVLCSAMEKDRTSADDDTSELPKKKEILGFTALGWMVTKDIGRDHWREVLSKPRSLVTQWHTLR